MQLITKLSESIPYKRKAKEPDEARRLVIRLLKFCDTQTPEDYAKNGEKWGGGQIDLIGHDGKIYRGQIAPPKRERADFKWCYNRHDKSPVPIPLEVLACLPLTYPTLENGIPRTTAHGLAVQIRCIWIARKETGARVDRWSIKTSTWQWELIPASTCLVLPIKTFHQNKTYRKDGILYPKRLFFETDRNESGYFAQRNDAENIRFENCVFTDPLRPSA